MTPTPDQAFFLGILCGLPLGILLLVALLALGHFIHDFSAEAQDELHHIRFPKDTHRNE